MTTFEREKSIAFVSKLQLTCVDFTVYDHWPNLQPYEI